MFIKEKRRELIVKENHQYFQSCHASSIVRLENGELVVVYFAGTREGTGDTAIWLSKKKNGYWGEPNKVVFEKGVPHWNPVLHLDNQRIWLFYKTGKAVPIWKTMVTYSDDFGFSWSKSQELVHGEPLPRGPVKNKILVLSNGAWLAASSIEGEFNWDSFVDCSFDDGVTWEKRDVPFDHCQMDNANEADLWQGLKDEELWENDLNEVFKWDGVIQPTLWESIPGQVHMLLRSTRGRIYRSDSRDYGKTWCTAYPTELPNNNSGIDILKMMNGDLVLVYNPVSGNWSKRSPLSISLSKDNGGTWTVPHHLETGEGEFSYPAIISYKNEIHVTYTWNRKNIIYQALKMKE